MSDTLNTLVRHLLAVGVMCVAIPLHAQVEPGVAAPAGVQEPTPAKTDEPPLQDLAPPAALDVPAQDAVPAPATPAVPEADVVAPPAVPEALPVSSAGQGKEPAGNGQPEIWWQAPRWKRLWSLTAFTMVPSLLVLAFPVAASLAAWVVAAGVMGASLQAAATTRDAQTASNITGIALAALGTAAGFTALMAVGGAAAYVVARVLTAALSPMPDSQELDTSRSGRMLRFLGVDVAFHAALVLPSLVLGGVAGAVVGGVLTLVGLVAPFVMCLPYCVPFPQVQPGSYGSAYITLTAIPLLMALGASGLFGTAMAAAQVFTPVATLMGLEWSANRPSAPPPPAPTHEEVLDD